MYLIMNIFLIVPMAFGSVQENTEKLFGKDVLMLDGKIVGGVNTTIEEYPYQVSIIRYGKHYCGGSLIKPNVVLSAAHCFMNNRTVKVRIGSTTRNQGGEIVNIKTIHKHPKYDSSTIDCDVSVLILEKSLVLSSKVQLITLQEVESDIPDGQMGIVTGWGTTSQGGSGSTILQAVEVPKFNTNACQKVYKGRITEQMICFGYSEGGKDSCQGDSGGPLIVNRTQVGIVSWGRGCAQSHYPGVYTKISSAEINDFIHEVLSKS